MSHTITAADVQRIAAAEAAFTHHDGSKKTAAEQRQGTRTAVHELLQEQCPQPYALPPPSRAFHPTEGAARNADIAARKAALIASIPDELIIESERARVDSTDGGHRDAVHYVQKKHGKALWAETDRLVIDALGGAS
jgi:hypothetical protein